MFGFGEAREERGQGVPLTDEERRARHYEQYGSFELPPRGTGLQSLGVIKGLGNPEIGISKPDIIGMVVGGLAGWFISTKFPNMVVKYVGVVVGAELGILIARMVGSKTTIVGGK